MSDNEKHYTPPPVTGYRTLTSVDVAFMNRVKEMEGRFLDLLDEVSKHVEDGYAAAYKGAEHPDGESVIESGMVEVLRIAEANPRRWLSIGRTHVEEASMAVCRAIAQPGKN